MPPCKCQARKNHFLSKRGQQIHVFELFKGSSFVRSDYSPHEKARECGNTRAAKAEGNGGRQRQVSVEGTYPQISNQSSLHQEANQKIMMTKLKYNYVDYGLLVTTG